MILLTDIANKLFEISKQLGIKNVYHSDNAPFGDVEEDRVIVSVGENVSGSIWDSLIAVVNVCVPDIDKNGTADLIRLSECEKSVVALFKDSQITPIGSDWVTIEWNTLSIEENTSLHCHYIHLVLKINTLNID